MKLNKRIFIESIIVSLFIVLLFYGWKVVRGMFLTNNYVPNILDNYNSTDYIQHVTSFGTVSNTNWVTPLTSIGGFLFILISYYVVRVALKARNVGGR